MLSPYQPLPRRARFIHDAPRHDRKERIGFHVEHDDYFATLATILGLVRDAIETATQSGAAPSVYYIETLKELQDDLMLLQREYRIIRK